MKHLLLASLVTLLAFGAACGQAPEPEPVASDGIQVHGDWTVTVTNPDGTVDVHEFENELLGGGKVYSALILNEASASEFKIFLDHTYTGGVTEYLQCPGAIVNYPGRTILAAAASRDLATYGTPMVITATCDVEEFSGDIVIYELRQCIGFDTPIHTVSSFEGDLPPTLESACVTKHTFPSSEQIEVRNGQTLSFNIIVSFT